MAEKKQRGSGWSIRLAFFFYDLFGYKFLYYLLYPITLFYFFVASNVKESLKKYYAHLGSNFDNWIYYKHLHVFAITLTDRFISKITPEAYAFTYEQDIPIETLEKGAVLVYSHFGGWSASSSGAHVSNKINIVMQEIMNSGMKKIESALGIKSQLNVIDLSQGTVAVSVQIANALMNKELVAMMADRASNEKAEITIPFLNEEANFNKNPFQIAYKMDKPAVVYFIIWAGIQLYKVEYIIITLDKTKNEEEAVHEAAERYVKKYEEVVKRYPDQWFNFYDFWEKK